MQETLESVFAQSLKDFEVIVINDGSPDTVELENAIERYRHAITYLKQANQGAGAARNAGLRVARGRFVAFLDGDDIWLPNFLNEQLKLIQSDGGYDLVYADAVNFGGPSDGRTSMEANPSDGEVTFDKLLCGECNVITSAVVARKELIMRVGLFDVNFPNSQDFDLWLRLAKDAKARITYQRRVLVRRRLYQGSLASDSVKSFEGELRVLEKVGRRADLTSRERAALERTVAVRRTSAEVIRGKRFLLSGDFADAARSFESANACIPSWKLRLVLWSLRVAPRVTRQVYRVQESRSGDISIRA
jgi:glycosyltransferase involved in cell wall biosynthesis